MSIFKTLNEMLVANATGKRTLTFIEGQDKEYKISYERLFEDAKGMLAHLQKQGLVAGDELIIHTNDNRQFVIAFWGAVLGGIVPVPVGVGISDEHRSKLIKIFSKLERAYLFTQKEHLDRLRKYASGHHHLEDYSNIQAKTILAESILKINQQGKLYPVNEHDVALIQFSSGSTSDPKGVVLTHKNLLTNMRAIAEGASYTDKDISLSWMPLTHDMGLVGFHLNMLAVNMSQCLMQTDLFSRRPIIWLKKVSEHRASVICSPNFGYKHFLKALGDKQIENMDLCCVRVCYNGAEPISVDLIEQFLSATEVCGFKPEAMFTVYGLAEATLAVAFPVQGKLYRAVHLDRQRLKLADKIHIVDLDHANAVSFTIEGKPVRDMEVKITGESNRTLKEDHIGDIQIRGPSVTSGYYQNEEANHTALTGEGWLNTGDLGFLHNGELVVTGRTKEIIFANGNNYYPQDIENIALQSRRLELGKVVACGVRKDKEQQDVLLIFILHRGKLSDFITLAGEVKKIISEQAGLEINKVIPIKRIPKTTSGKLQRNALGKAYLQGEFDEVLTELDALTQLKASAEEVNGMTLIEMEVSQICTEVLNGKIIRLNDNFFDVGINSLYLAEIHQCIDEKYPGLTDPDDLLEYQTVAELSTFIERKKNASW